MSLKQKTISGLSWSFASQGVKQVSQFIITAILARLLSPGDFGLIGMATVFTGFVAMVNEMGVSGALIQKQDVDERHYSSVFWLNIVVGTLMMLAMIAVSAPIAGFYNKPELGPILRLLSVNFVIASFSIVQQTLFQKHLDFKKLAIVETVAVIVAGAVGIYSALHGKGAWSLVYQMLALTLTTMVMLWVLSSWKPKFIVSLAAIKDIFHFSANLAGFNIVNYFARNVDYLLIGKFLGAEALGFYTLAYKLMLYPLQNISSVIGKVMFPALSTIQNDVAKVRQVYLKMIRAIAMVTFPMMFGLFAVAPEFVAVIYGSRWTEAVPLIRILCICGLFQSIGTTIGNIYMSQGRADLQFKLQLLGTAIVTIFVLIGLRWGIVGVAACYTLQAVVWVSGSLYIVARLIRSSLGQINLAIMRPFILAILMLGFIFAVKAVPSISISISLATQIALGFLGYCLFLIMSKLVLVERGAFKINFD